MASKSKNKNIQISQLAKKYAPVFVFDTKEKYYPCG
jgi:hypothetical protein